MPKCPKRGWASPCSWEKKARATSPYSKRHLETSTAHQHMAFRDCPETPWLYTDYRAGQCFQLLWLGAGGLYFLRTTQRMLRKPTGSRAPTLGAVQTRPSSIMP